MAKVLVTGGAGYIGSHTTLALLEAGFEVVVYDNLSTGRADAVLPPARLVVGDLAETDRLDALMAGEGFDAVLHFAGSIVVPESVENPLKYYMNNTNNTTELIRLAVKNAIPRFVFSSTAAVYGMPDTPAVTEDSPTKPINPYGRTKLISEWVIQDTAAAHPDFAFVILRYFNVAGADPEGRIGQCTPNATHLIKVASQAALGRREALHIFGTDYDTPDGTCIRDYVHTTDLAAAHLAAIEATGPETAEVFNIGTGQGTSVKEIIAACEKVTGRKIPVEISARRPGDPPALVADPKKLKTQLGWTPRYSSIEETIATAWAWHQAHPQGYGDRPGK